MLLYTCCADIRQSKIVLHKHCASLQREELELSRHSLHEHVSDEQAKEFCRMAHTKGAQPHRSNELHHITYSALLHPNHAGFEADESGGTCLQPQLKI